MGHRPEDLRANQHPYKTKTKKNQKRQIFGVIYNYIMEEARVVENTQSRVANLASRVALSQLKKPRVMQDLPRVIVYSTTLQPPE